MGFEELRAQLEEVEESIKKFLQDAENEKRVLINKHELAKIAHDRRVSNLHRDQQIGSEAVSLPISRCRLTTRQPATCKD
eukprot:1221418-Rhodomonas_salina.1